MKSLQFAECFMRSNSSEGNIGRYSKMNNVFIEFICFISNVYKNSDFVRFVSGILFELCMSYRRVVGS